MGNKKVATEKVVGWTVVAGLTAALGFGLAPIITNANAEPAAVVETADASTIDLTAIGYTNGLASEQEGEAAAAEAARIAAEAEAARVAAEQAAAAEAQRIAAEQAAAQAEQQAAESYDDEPSGDTPADDPWAGKIRVPWIPSSDPNNAAGGDWDMSVCGGGSASTGPDGNPYCD